MASVDEKIAEIDKRLAVAETKLDIHANMIEEIKEIMNKLDEKIDRLIQIQSFGKWKHSLMWSGVGSGLLGLVHLILSHLGNK